MTLTGSISGSENRVVPVLSDISRFISDLRPWYAPLNAPAIGDFGIQVFVIPAISMTLVLAIVVSIEFVTKRTVSAAAANLLFIAASLSLLGIGYFWGISKLFPRTLFVFGSGETLSSDLAWRRKIVAGAMSTLILAALTAAFLKIIGLAN